LLFISLLNRVFNLGFATESSLPIFAVGIEVSEFNVDLSEGTYVRG
jgi:hypothetical protein